MAPERFRNHSPVRRRGRGAHRGRSGGRRAALLGRLPRRRLPFRRGRRVARADRRDRRSLRFRRHRAAPAARRDLRRRGDAVPRERPGAAAHDRAAPGRAGPARGRGAIRAQARARDARVGGGESYSSRRPPSSPTRAEALGAERLARWRTLRAHGRNRCLRRLPAQLQRAAGAGAAPCARTTSTSCRTRSTRGRARGLLLIGAGVGAGRRMRAWAAAKAIRRAGRRARPDCFAFVELIPIVGLHPSSRLVGWPSSSSALRRAIQPTGTRTVPPPPRRIPPVKTRRRQWILG